MSLPLKEDILFLVSILSASVLVSALVCTLSLEGVD